MSNGKIAPVLVEIWKKKKSFKRGLKRAWNKRQEKEREVKAGRERGSVRKRVMLGFHCFALKFLSPHFYLLIFPSLNNIYSSLAQKLSTLRFGASLRSEFSTEINRNMWSEIEIPRSIHLDTSILLFWIISAPQSVLGFVTDFVFPFLCSVSYRQTEPTMFSLSSTLSAPWEPTMLIRYLLWQRVRERERDETW